MRRGLRMWREAVDSLSKARKLREEALGPEHPDTLRSTESLAAAL
jgi:hypothetical protein